MTYVLKTPSPRSPQDASQIPGRTCESVQPLAEKSLRAPPEASQEPGGVAIPFQASKSLSQKRATMFGKMG